MFTNSATFRRDYKSYLEKKRRRAGLRRPPALAAMVQAAADPPLGGGVGGMPTLELAVLKAVGERDLIARVHVLFERAPAAGADAVVGRGAPCSPTSMEPALGRRCRRAIKAGGGGGRRTRRSSGATCSAMTVDLFFLGLAKTLADAAEDLSCPPLR